MFLGPILFLIVAITGRRSYSRSTSPFLNLELALWNCSNVRIWNGCRIVKKNQIQIAFEMSACFFEKEFLAKWSTVVEHSGLNLHLWIFGNRYGLTVPSDTRSSSPVQQNHFRFPLPRCRESDFNQESRLEPSVTFP